MSKAEGNGSIYENLGVDPHKSGVKESFKKVISNGYPNAFCNIIDDPFAPGWVLCSHSDGSGSKSVQRILAYLEQRRLGPGVFRHDIYDAVGMNTGDMACCGFIDNLVITDTVAINGANVPKELILNELALGIAELKKLYARYGIKMYFMGGETADLPDQTSSYILDANVSCRMKGSGLIKGDIVPGDMIFGFSSTGQAAWEEAQNSGQMSNGLTMSRTVLMHKDYSARYPFLCRPDKPYRGRFRVADGKEEFGGIMTVSEAILSPTRQWVIVIKLLLDYLRKRKSTHLLHGLVMNTGGGATKIKNIGKGILYKKTNMPEIPLLFDLIQKETGEEWANMYQTFNMGVGLDVIGLNKDGILEEALLYTSGMSRIPFFKLGRCEQSPDGENHVELFLPDGSKHEY